MRARLMIASDQAHILTDKDVQGPPALVVEILSPGTRRRDEATKRQLFERGGVREYWLVDPERDLLTVYRRAADGPFARVSDLGAAADVALTTPLLPGFALSLTEFFLRT